MTARAYFISLKLVAMFKSHIVETGSISTSEADVGVTNGGEGHINYLAEVRITAPIPRNASKAGKEVVDDLTDLPELGLQAKWHPSNNKVYGLTDLPTFPE